MRRCAGVPISVKKLEQLCRYITRPAIANERLQRNRAGQVVLQLKSPYKDGTTHIVMEPLEFMERLAALVPHPRLHLIRFHGVLVAQREIAQSNRSRSAPCASSSSRFIPNDLSKQNCLRPQGEASLPLSAPGAAT